MQAEALQFIANSEMNEFQNSLNPECNKPVINSTHTYNDMCSPQSFAPEHFAYLSTYCTPYL